MYLIGMTGTKKPANKMSHSQLILDTMKEYSSQDNIEFKTIKLLDYSIKSFDNIPAEICDFDDLSYFENDPTDEFMTVYDHLKKSDGIVICSPIYGEGHSAILINFLNRLSVYCKVNDFQFNLPLLNISICGGVGASMGLYEMEYFSYFLGFKIIDYLGMGMLNSDTEFIGTTGFISPIDSEGITRLITSSYKKLVNHINGSRE